MFLSHIVHTTPDSITNYKNLIFFNFFLQNDSVIFASHKVPKFVTDQTYYTIEHCIINTRITYS